MAKPLESPLYTGVNLVGFVVVVAEGFFKIHKRIAVIAQCRCKAKAYIIPCAFVFVFFTQSAGNIRRRYILVAQKFVQQVGFNVNSAVFVKVTPKAEARAAD